MSADSIAAVILIGGFFLLLLMRLPVALALALSSVASALSVFEELGFLSIVGYDTQRRVRMVPSPGHVDLSNSLRYVEGLHALHAFEQFRMWALSALPQEMLESINRPITPSFGCTVDR